MQNQSSSTPKQSGLTWSQPASTNNQNMGQKPQAQQQKAPAPVLPRPGYVAPPYLQKQVPTRKNKRFLGILAGGVLLGFFVAWAWFAFRPSPEAVVTTTDTAGTAVGNATTAAAGGTAASGSTNAGTVAAASGIQAQPGDALSVPTPQHTGDKVLVTGIKVSVPTWVVVYETKSGARANALGAALFFPTSPNSAVNIGLLRATSPNQTYFVGRSVDDGDKVFSMQADRPVVDASGSPIYSSFQTE